MEFALGGTAAMVATVFTNPLECIKTRMQLQGELKRRGKHVIHYKSFLHAAFVISRHDGLLALQKGLVPSLYFQFLFNGWRLGGYQLIQQKGLVSDQDGNIIFNKNLLASGLLGSIGMYLTSPFILMKTQFQSKAAKEIAFGHQYNYSGILPAFKKILKENGVKGLYRGSTAAAICAFVGSTSQLMSFSYVKQFMKDKNILQESPILAATAASFVGGIVLCIFMTPFDLILTRLYNQGVDERGQKMLYNNFINCVRRIWETEGFFGFYKGIGPSYIRLGPHTLICLVTWEKLQNIFNTINESTDN